ncbi:MAG: S8 family serine peptidase [Blastocatellia bacterium]
MPFIYSATRQKRELILSPDDIGVRFETSEVTRSAVRAARSAMAAGEGAPETSPRGYDRVMLIHQAGAARTSFATVRAALSASHTRGVRRTLPVYIEPESKLRMICTREITVRFKPGVDARRQQKFLTDLKLVKDRASDFAARQFIVTSSLDVDEAVTLDLANTLAERDDVVEFAAPNFVSQYRKEAATNDPQLAQQWHLNNRGAGGGLAGEDVNAFAAWDLLPGGSRDIVIAIVDDGVDIRHPDLRANIWVNPDPSAPDRNGRNFFDDDFDPRPRYFRAPFDQLAGNDIHGTPCAGVAAAVGHNRRGVSGIAYNCRILAVKIFGADDLAPDDRVADSIRYSGRNAQVISCSWSGPSSPDLETAINDVVRTGRGGRGCLVFCATGNDFASRIAFPASHPLTMAVGASNDRGKRSGYSNFGPGMDFVAPSSDRGRQGITTTDLSNRNRGFNLTSSYTDRFGGTSSATPLAAGVGALALSANPALTADEARNILRGTAEKIDTAGGAYSGGFSLQYGFGRVDAEAAVRKAIASRSGGGTRAAAGRKTAKKKPAGKSRSRGK